MFKRSPRSKLGPYCVMLQGLAGLAHNPYHFFHVLLFKINLAVAAFEDKG